MFAEMMRLETMENVVIDGLDHIPAENMISKVERKFQLTFESVLGKELHKIVNNPSLKHFQIQKDEHRYIVEDNQAYFEGYNFLETDPQVFTMNISTLKDVNESAGFMRMTIPISRNFWVHNLRTYSIKTEKSIFGGLLVLKFEEGEVHVFTVTGHHTKQQYMVVEPQFEVTREKLFYIHYAVATGLGIITGTAYFGEAYVFVGDSLEFDSCRAVSYYSLRETVHSQYSTFTTNLYWVDMVLKQGKYNSYALEMITDEKGEVKRGLVDWLYEDVYGQIIQNMYQYPEFARAAIILLDGTDKALDYQAAMYAVALETLCTKLKAIYGMKFDGIIKDKGTWTRIRKPMTKTFHKFCKQYNIDKNITDKITQKIPNLNEISNTDKFNLIIDKLGIKKMLSDDDAMRQRNNLLHGELVEKTAENSTDFDDMYYYSLVLYRLCTNIIFKFAGYKGWLVNNAVVMDRKVACERREPVLFQV